MPRLPALLLLNLLVVGGWRAHLVPPTRALRAARAAAVLLQVEEVFDDDDDDDDEELSAAQVDLIETSTGRVLPCYLAASLEYEGETFAALYPADAPVSLAQSVAGKLVPVEDDLETPELLAAAADACARNDIVLMQTPVVLTASGPGLDEVEQAADALESEGGDGLLDDDGEEVLVLAEGQLGSDPFAVVQTLDPLYVVGKKLDEGRFAVPTDAEIEAVGDTIEQLVIEFEEAFDQDDDDDEFGP